MDMPVGLMIFFSSVMPVSYTHLDVYKRQVQEIFFYIQGTTLQIAFNVVYKEEPSTLNMNMDQWMNPDEGEKKGGSSIRVTELGLSLIPIYCLYPPGGWSPPDGQTATPFVCRGRENARKRVLR